MTFAERRFHIRRIQGGPAGIGAVVHGGELASRDQRVVMTGDTGEFVLVGLPAATYTLHASALGYVGRQYGQRHTFGDGVPIELQTAEVRTEVDVALIPGGAIAGRITTESGNRSRSPRSRRSARSSKAVAGSGCR